MKENWKIYAVWIAITEAVGALAGYLTRNSMELYAETIIKPPLAPPGWLFPVVWVLLYALMGIGAARVWLAEKTPERFWALNIYVAQLVVNFFWPLIFFNLQAFGFALVWLLILWALVALMIFLFARVDRLAALLQIPYLIWLTFAVYLNWAVWQRN